MVFSTFLGDVNKALNKDCKNQYRECKSQFAGQGETAICAQFIVPSARWNNSPMRARRAAASGASEVP